MSDGLDAARRALETLQGVLAKRPHKDDHALADATRDLCVWRNRLIERADAADRDRLDRTNAVLSVVAGVHYPLAKPPWEALETAVRELERLVGTAPA